MKINEILKNLIDVHKVNTLELSRQTGVPQSVIYRIITDETKNPSIATVCALANYFGMNVNQMIGEESTNTPASNNDVAIFKIPILPWKQANEWADLISKNAVNWQENTFIDFSPSKNLYALKMNDESMMPIFKKGTLLIIDGKKPPKNESYVVVKPANTNIVVLRQLLINNNLKYLRPLNPDSDKYKVQLFDEKDVYCGLLIESRYKHEI